MNGGADRRTQRPNPGRCGGRCIWPATSPADGVLITENFKSTVYANDNVLVYFWAPLCEPCDMVSPTCDASSEKQPDIVHGDVKVRLLPTLMASRRGNLVFKQAGIANAAVTDDLVRHGVQGRSGAASAAT